MTPREGGGSACAKTDWGLAKNRMGCVPKIGRGACQKATQRQPQKAENRAHWLREHTRTGKTEVPLVVDEHVFRLQVAEDNI